MVGKATGKARLPTVEFRGRFQQTIGPSSPLLLTAVLLRRRCCWAPESCAAIDR